jgi:hypothetical protein
MPAPTPERNRTVYFVGAGLSRALGLPNTAELLSCVLALAGRSKRWSQTERLPARIDAAAKFFYPDAENKGYRPDVVDFFSALRTYIDVGSGLSGGFRDAPELFRALKFAIAQVLIDGTRDIDMKLQAGHRFLDRIVQPGNVVVTSNWDLVLERYAALRQVPLRLTGYDKSEFVVLKLHGSVDWCTSGRRSRRYTDSNFATLTEQLFATSPRRLRVPQARDTVIRIRALEDWPRAWSTVSSRALDLHMVTMARGKGGDLGPLQEVWRDAYGALSRASRLELVGYSLPDDDIEIRTLLRASILRGTGPRTLITRNPSPDVHERVWRFLSREARPDYQGISPLP